MGDSLDGGLPPGGAGSQSGSVADAASTAGSGSGSDSNGNQSLPTAETYQNTPVASLWSLPDSNSSVSVARSKASTNTVGASDPEPIIYPLLTIWKGHAGGPWTGYFMREPNKRNVPTNVTGKDNWAQNGCHPLCLAMILDWWQYKNADTNKSLAFSYPNDPAGPENPLKKSFEPPIGLDPAEPAGAINPLFMCRRLFNMPYVPSVKRSEFEVDHASIQNSVGPTIPDIDDPTSYLNGVTFMYNGRKVQMQSATYLNNGAGYLKAAIKYFLQFGPLMLLLPRPGHYVVAAGFRGNMMYICDSGDVIRNPAYWGKSPGVTPLRCGMVRVDVSSANFQFGDDVVDQNFLDPANISAIQIYNFAYDKVPNTDWSDPGKSPTPT